MKRFRLEVILGTVLAALFLLFCWWQNPGAKLSRADVDAYLKQIDARAVLPAPEKAELIAHLRGWGEADDGKPVYMLNLMRFYAELRPWPGADVRAASPAESNALYERVVIPMVLRSGTFPVVGSDVQGVLGGATPSTNLIGNEPAIENWSRVLVMRYPSRRAFFDLISDPEYLKVMPYKLAALKLALIPTDGALVVPDLRFVLGAIFLMAFLLFGWIRAASRR